MLKYIQPYLTFGTVVTHLRPQYIFFSTLRSYVVREVINKILWTSIPLKITRIFMTIFFWHWTRKKKKLVFSGNISHDITFLWNFKSIKLKLFLFKQWIEMLWEWIYYLGITFFRNFAKLSETIWSEIYVCALFGVNFAFNAQAHWKWCTCFVRWTRVVSCGDFLRLRTKHCIAQWIK